MFADIFEVDDFGDTGEILHQGLETGQLDEFVSCDDLGDICGAHGGLQVP